MGDRGRCDSAPNSNCCRMEQFPFMVECLKEFNYPRIHSMDEAEITDVFSKVNRQFLVGWILKQVDDGYSDIVDKERKEDLADLIQCMGFCGAGEKEKFISGECESSRQFIILYKMFKHLKCVSVSKQLPEQTKTVPVKVIENCLAFDTNVFPKYGVKQTLNPQERQKKIEDYRAEIETLRTALNTERVPETDLDIDPTLNHQLTAAMTNLDINFPDFHRKFMDVTKNRDTVADNKGLFSEEFAQTLETCSENAKTASEFIKNMNVLMNPKDSSEEHVDFDKKRNAMMRELAELCSEVATLKKEQHF